MSVTIPTTKLRNYVNTSKRIRIVIGGREWSSNLVSGTISDSDITGGSLVFSTGSFELAGHDAGGSPVVEYDFTIGDLVTISALFTSGAGKGVMAPHPRTNMYVVNYVRNFNAGTVTIEVACRLSVIKDFGTNDSLEIRDYINNLEGIENILASCQIDTFDMNTLEAALAATGSFGYMAYGQFVVKKWAKELSKDVAFTAWTKHSCLGVEDLQDALIPPVKLTLEEDLETPGYPEEDDDDDDRDKDPDECQRESECTDDEICVDGYCEEVECDSKILLQVRALELQINRLKEANPPDESKIAALESQKEALLEKAREAECPEGYTCADNELCVPDSCDNEDDCVGGFICVDGECQDSYCGTDGQCPTDYICIDGVCESIDCSQGQECPEGYQCTDGDCTEIECLDDRYCRRSGGICVDGKCVDVDCTDDEDCGDGYECVDNQCHLLPTFCQDDSDCAADEVCINGQCHVIDGDCQNDIDCKPGFVCVDGSCVESEEEEQEEEDEEPDDFVNETISDIQYMLTKAIKLKPFNQCLQIRRGKFHPDDLERLDRADNGDGAGSLIPNIDINNTHLRCGIYVNPNVRSKEADAALAGLGAGSSECTTALDPEDIEEVMGVKSVYGYKAEGSLLTEDDYFSDNVEKISQFTNFGPGNQMDTEDTMEVMSVWRANESGISSVIEQVATAYDARISTMQELCDQINEYGQLRDDNDPSKIEILGQCIDVETLRKMYAARDFYDCMMGDAQIKLQNMIYQAQHLYNWANSFLNAMKGKRVNTNIVKTKITFGLAGEVKNKETKNYIHGGSSKLVAEKVKEIYFTNSGAAYRGPIYLYDLFTTTDQNIDSDFLVDGYNRIMLKSETVDEYIYGVGTVKHTNRKIDHENPQNNTTHIVVSTDNSVAPEAPPRNVPLSERISDIDFDGIPDEEDPDMDGDGILNENDPNPRRPDSDIDADGIADENDDDIDGDGVPNRLDPNPRYDDSNGPDKDGDGKPNILDDDIDGDGFQNQDDPDIDGDGIPNDLDADIDGDGYPNSRDPDMDGDGTHNDEDANPRSSFVDTDDDGTPDAIDDDDDNDGLDDDEDPNPLVPDLDTDGDGLYDFEDPDIDNDGLPNASDPDPYTEAGDLDGDGLYDYEDDDIDGDGILNEQDPNPYNQDTEDLDNDGIPDVTDDDIDGDGLLNGEDPNPNSPDEDTDEDGLYDFEDPDIDNDGVLNEEDPDPFVPAPDTDNDGIADIVDIDIDGDEIPNEEDPDADGDGIPGYADVDDLDPDAQFEEGIELRDCNIETDEYKIELSITLEGRQSQIAGIPVGGTEQVSFPLQFQPLVPENIKALTLDEQGDPKFMAPAECDATAAAFREAAATRLAAIEELCQSYLVTEAMKYKLRGNSLRIVETMRPELFSWHPLFRVSVTGAKDTLGKYFTTATTWGFDQYNMVVSLDLIGYGTK